MVYMENYNHWRSNPALSPAEKAELEGISNDQKEIENRFYGPLEFGTAGLRGIMGVGLNRMNIHIIRHTTQAFAELILRESFEHTGGIAICFDCRNNSEEFAKEAACVMAGNGIPVKLFSSLRPTPELSFAVREYQCIAGINITASHNPKEYNGYKVYWSDGAQLPPHHANQISQTMEQIDVFTSIQKMDFDTALSHNLITILDEETDNRFLSEVENMINDRETIQAIADDFRMVYTPFHGTGYKLIPQVLKSFGIKHLSCVKEQQVIDGNFPTVPSPNPENFNSFSLAIKLAKETNADIIVGSDPDADRVGILAKDDVNEYQLISGNQTGVLLLDYLIHIKQKNNTLPQNSIVLKTIVTTQMANKIAEHNGVQCMDTFTGFKYMAEKKEALESANKGHVFFSYEESFGYMLGDYVRDKDAVTATLLLTEMAVHYKSRQMTLFDAIDELYRKYGYYEEQTLNLLMPGLDGMQKMKNLMATLRNAPLKQIAGTQVRSYIDYETGTQTIYKTNERVSAPLKGSNVLHFKLEDETDIFVRPSGTEPKIKIYILVQGDDKQTCQQRVLDYVTWGKGDLT